MRKRRKACIPLLDVLDSESADKFVTPLPSAHLPLELSSPHLYVMDFERPVHKMIIDEALYGENKEVDENGEKVQAYGYIVKRKSEDSLVGAVGCTAEVLLNFEQDDFIPSDGGNDVPITVLCRGSYRFVVKEVIKTIPYPVGIVEELVDEAPLQPEPAEKNDEDDDDEDDEDEDDDDEENPYADLDSSELVRRTMVGLHMLIDQKLNDATSSLSPLEKSILEETGFNTNNSAQEEQSKAEEMAAVLDVFQSSLIDIAPMPIDRYYAIGMLAAQMANVDNRTRQDIITMTDGLARLRVVLRGLESTVNMNRAKKVARTITDGLDEEQKELKVRFGWNHA
jgi:ATP-dependent Lon protease